MQIFPIAVKELFPVVIATAIYGNQWSGKLVQFKVDNLAVVQVLQATYSQEPHLMHLVRLLVFFAAHFNFWFSASHIAGTDNSLADSLSRNNTQLFLSQVPQAVRHPSRIPPPLIKLLECNLTWTTTAWTMLFRATLQQLQPPQPIQLIRQQNVDIYLFVATFISSLAYYRSILMLFCCLLRSAGPGSLHHSHLFVRDQIVSNCSWL